MSINSFQLIWKVVYFILISVILIKMLIFIKYGWQMFVLHISHKFCEYSTENLHMQFYFALKFSV